MGFCSCIPPPASVQPRKTYNILVPDVFGNLGPAPKLEDPISSGTARKIGKLQEYVQNNPSKAAKVSRRLTRRIKKALNEHTLGDVKVAVHAYKHLLNESTAKDSSYTFSYFSKELIQEPDVVVSICKQAAQVEVCLSGSGLKRAAALAGPLCHCFFKQAH
eukprot:1157694-Pelagomonas_calceolata.AAC.1